MKFFHFHQNNSGGFFDNYAGSGIGCGVIIEAGSAADANTRAEAIGLYFDGCASRTDCSCCGDRWSAQRDDEDGTDSPQYYGYKVRPITLEDAPDPKNRKTLYIHYADGTFKAAVATKGASK